MRRRMRLRRRRLGTVGLAALAIATLLGGAWDAAGRAASDELEAAKESRRSGIATTDSSAAPEEAVDPAPRKMDASKERRLAVMRAELASLEADRDEAQAQLDVDRAEAAGRQTRSEHDPEARDEHEMLDALAAAQEAQVSQYEAMMRAKEAEIRIAERRAAPQPFGEV